MTTTLISIRIPDELNEYLKDKADREHRTLSNTIIAILLDAERREEIHRGKPPKVVNNIHQHSPNAPLVGRCPNCGKKVEGRLSYFCKYCGQRITWTI